FDHRLLLVEVRAERSARKGFFSQVRRSVSILFLIFLFLTADLKLARFPARSPLAVAALPSMSLIPSAPFTNDTDDQTMRKKLNGRSLDDKALSLTLWSRNCGTALPTNNLRLRRRRLPAVRAGQA